MMRRLGQAATVAGGAVPRSPVLCAQGDGACARVAARHVEAACVLQGCVAWRALVVCLPVCWVRVRGCKHVGVARLDSTGRRISKKEASWRDHGLEKKIIR